MHENQPVKTAGKTLENAEKAVIMIHGRGATAESILGLKDQLPNAAFLAPQAANRTWYPKSFLEPREENQPHLDSALDKINSIVEKASSAVGKENVYLLGFSQGACLVSEYAASKPERYGGVFALSGGLIGEELREYTGNLEKMPVFIGCDSNDPHIPLERVKATSKVFEKLNADIDERIYDSLGHGINQDEIDAINNMIARKV